MLFRSRHIFNPGPREAADFPKKRSGRHIGPSVPHRRESPMTMTCLFFFMEAVLMQGIGRLNLGDSSNLDEPSSSSLFGSTCSASYLLCQGTWEGGGVTEETRLLRRAGTCRHCPLPLKSLRSAGWGEDRESSYHVSCLPDRPVPGMAGCGPSRISPSRTP